jgi:hypothetical protein
MIKAGLIIILWVFCLLPSEIGWAVWHIVGPDSVLSRILLLGIGIYFLGGLQVVGAIFGLCCTCAIAVNDDL